MVVNKQETTAACFLTLIYYLCPTPSVPRPPSLPILILVHIYRSTLSSWKPALGSLHVHSSDNKSRCDGSA